MVEELNRTAAADRGCQLSLWHWRFDARPGIHRDGPQAPIDELMRIEEADIVVGIFWRRFGTPTRTAGSGTEHELRRAYQAWKARERPELMLYFCTRAYAPTTVDDLTQWLRVFEYRDALPPEILSWRYASAPEFADLLREHVTRYLLRRFPPPDEPHRDQLRFNLPTVAKVFAGRDVELDAIDDALGTTDRGLIAQTISGLGGVGKSQLAARYVQLRTQDYDVVAWIGAEDGGTADLAAFAAHIAEPGDALSVSQRAQLALEWLGTTSKRWLLVLDNVSSPAQLDKLRPRGGDGRVLVTSRYRELCEGASALALDVFSLDAATAYLTERANRPGEEADARRLATALGCLPLALSHAAAYCRSGTSFADYHALLDELPAHELFGSHPEWSYAQTVASTWKTSIHASVERAPLAANVLEIAAHLGPDAIPKQWFSGLVGQLDGARGDKQLADCFRALADFSLVTVDGDNISVHRLLQKTVRDDSRMRGDRSAAVCALAAVCRALPDDVSDPADWADCERLRPHAIALSQAFPLPPDDAGERLTFVLNELCQYHNWSEPGIEGRGLKTATDTLRYAEQVLDASSRQRFLARARVAAAYRYEAQLEQAIALFAALLVDCERALGHIDPDTLLVRHLLAYSYYDARHDRGRLDEAIVIYEQVLADRERVLGSDHPDTLMSRNNLAVAYHAADRISEALELFERVLPERQRVIGAEHPSTLTTRHNFALCTQTAGRTDDAIDMFTTLLADRERVLGKEHPQTLVTRKCLQHARGDSPLMSEAH